MHRAGDDLWITRGNTVYQMYKTTRLWLSNDKKQYVDNSWVVGVQHVNYGL